MNKFIINGAVIVDIASFYVEINRVFMEDVDWKLGRSLDAFSDLLYGGFGAIVSDETNEIIWLDSDKSKAALGYETTLRYYKDKLKPDSPFNKALFVQKIKELEHGQGKTYYEIIKEIISEHSNIILIEK